MTRPLDSELHALVDGTLTAERKAVVREWLDQHPEEASRVQDWVAQKEVLHALFDPVLEEPVPDRLLRSARRPARSRIVPKLAAAIAWMVIGTIAGFALRGYWPATPGQSLAAVSLPQQAAVAHVVYTPEVRHPVEVGGDQETHLMQWLSNRLGDKLIIPKLGEQGYQLVGGRLLPGTEGPAAQFMYQANSGLRLTLYVRRNDGSDETAFRFANEGRLSVFYWVNGSFGYALSGELPREKMLALAELAHRQLSMRD